MKGIITFIFAGSALLATAQTPLIAHKSHAGASISYFIEPGSNFGAIEINHEFQLTYNLSKNFKPLNDSVILMETVDFDQQVIRTDTLLNKGKLSPFTFEFKYRDSILKNEVFESKKRRIEQEKQFIKEQMEQQQKLNEPVSSKKKKKSYLLFLFGITGGGMLLMKVFSRSKIIQHSIV
nr:hypothetical protein [uncultured Fluviicola sp.]